MTLPEDLTMVERHEIRKVVEKLLAGVGCPCDHPLQVERVLVLLSHSDTASHRPIRTPQDIIETFGHDKRIPPALKRALRKVRGKDDCAVEAVSFAAWAYPNRADLRLKPKELRKRVESFVHAFKSQSAPEQLLHERLSHLQEYGRRRVRDWSRWINKWVKKRDKLAQAMRSHLGPKRQRMEQDYARIEKNIAVAHRYIAPIEKALPRLPVANDDLAVLLKDLTSVESVRNQSCGPIRQRKSLAPSGRTQQERRKGAIFYLLTCTNDQLIRIIANWLDDADLVRFLRTQLMVPPSCLLDLNRVPDPEALVRGLSERFPGTSPGILKTAAKLEYVAMRILAGRHDLVHPVSEHVLKCWEKAIDCLLSGFPFYAFLSHYMQWWKALVSNYSVRRLPPHVLEEPSEPHVEPQRVYPEILRVCREGYRLVRTTFFVLTPHRSPEDGMARQDVSVMERAYEADGGSAQRMTPTEQIRRVVDHACHDLLKNQGCELSQQTLSGLLQAYPGLGESRINNAAHDAHTRLKAYMHARWHGKTNQQILKSAGSRPAGVETVASLARAVPKEFTLFWAFTSRVFLHPRVVDPQHPDDWDFTRWVGELSWWVCEPFWKALKHGAACERAPDKEALRLSDEEPFKSLVEDLDNVRLQACGDIEQMYGRIDAWLRKHSDDLKGAGQACREVLDAFWETKQRSIDPVGGLWDLRRAAKSHWIVPAWYLIHIEGHDVGEAMKRLRPDPDDMPRVRTLLQSLDSRRQGLAGRKTTAPQ